MGDCTKELERWRGVMFIYKENGIDETQFKIWLKLFIFTFHQIYWQKSIVTGMWWKRERVGGNLGRAFSHIYRFSAPVLDSSKWKLFPTKSILIGNHHLWINIFFFGYIDKCFKIIVFVFFGEFVKTFVMKRGSRRRIHPLFFPHSKCCSKCWTILKSVL